MIISPVLEAFKCNLWISFCNTSIGTLLFAMLCFHLESEISSWLFSLVLSTVNRCTVCSRLVTWLSRLELSTLCCCTLCSRLWLWLSSLFSRVSMTKAKPSGSVPSLVQDANCKISRATTITLITREIMHNNANHNISVHSYSKVVARLNITYINNSEINVSLALNITLPNMGSLVSHK